jgi:hypothetical protein
LTPVIPSVKSSRARALFFSTMPPKPNQRRKRASAASNAAIPPPSRSTDSRSDPCSAMDANFRAFQSQFDDVKDGLGEAECAMFEGLQTLLEGTMAMMRSQAEKISTLLETLKASSSLTQPQATPLEPLSKVQQQFDYNSHLEEETRLRSIIIAGHPEQDDQLDSIGKVMKDYADVRDIFRVMGVEALQQTCYRIGQPDPKRPRLLHVLLPAPRFQHQILAKRRLLKDNARFKAVFIEPSMSKAQRRDAFLLREERRRQIALDARLQDQLVIYKGALMNRRDIPTRGNAVPAPINAQHVNVRRRPAAPVVSP